MDTHYDIEKLSTELMLYVLREVSIVKQHNITLRHGYIGPVLRSTGEAFSRSFRMLHVSCSMEDLDPVQFAHKCIRVCLKMSTDPDLFHTMLACSFITESATMLAKNNKCFKYVFMAWKCLVVLLTKKLGNEPNYLKVSWHAFKGYMREINARLSRRREPRSILDVLTEDFEVRQSTLQMVEDCYLALQEEMEELTPEDIQFLDANDIPEDARANFDKLPICKFCQQECELSVHFCLTRLLNSHSKDYEIML